LGVDRLLHACVQPAAAGRAHLSADSAKMAHTLLGRIQPRAPLSVTPQRREATRTHLMVSYAWAARKDLVVALVADLRGRGYDVRSCESGMNFILNESANR
jgi:hypothetical protein